MAIITLIERSQIELMQPRKDSDRMTMMAIQTKLRRLIDRQVLKSQ
ncbi:hypothetical protein Lpp27_17704 [Lacticaseibacillus paracasei subsp. paracasei CNCM I-4648]|nr:hypothetical protein Lpp27_17704 [Lacticaseibacillus paracasei subsp. paracasei CNCM I-4648]